jgi:WD40 repeat protein
MEHPERRVVPLRGNGNLVLRVALSSDGAQTLSLGEGEEENIVARLSDVGSGREMGPFSVEEHTVCVAFSPDGRRVLTGGWEGSLPLREAESGRKIRRLLGGHERAVTRVE